LLRPKKSLGQNFLRDENILRNIVKSLDIQESDVVVEIGSGHGALTKYLVEYPVALICIEVDNRAVELLRGSFGDRINLVHADVLKVDLGDISLRHKKRLRIVGNIPYYLTSEILFQLFDARAVVKDATLMMQFEVVHRLVSPPRKKDYGILSVFSQFYAECRMLFKVSRNCFFPKPEVDSAVVHLKFKQQLQKCDEQHFRSVVRATFGKRRKTLRNGLKSMGYDDKLLGSINFDLTKRPEELSVENFVTLANLLDRRI
jgi:16S rRNA (adenine1518-N6/adenine1519-N6)-dimethyltransferase